MLLHRYVLIFILKWTLVDADCDVVGKKEWKGLNPHHVEYVPRPVNLVIISHTETPWCSNSEQCKRSIKSMQDNTISSKGFDDVGYSHRVKIEYFTIEKPNITLRVLGPQRDGYAAIQLRHRGRCIGPSCEKPTIVTEFIIGGDGKAYEGVGWIRVGFHTIGYDRTAIGIAFIGNYNNDAPTAQQLRALRELLNCGVKLGHLIPDFRIVCHRQLILTESPGKSLYDEVTKWPQWLESIDKISGPRSLIITTYATELGIYDSRTGLLNISGLDNQIYDSVVSGDYNNAVDLSIILDKFGGEKEMESVVKRLLENNVSKNMNYAYKLWNYGGQKILLKYFPIEFQIIFSGEAFVIQNIKDGQALKMDANVDSDGDRNVWGDSKDKSSNRMKWKMFTVWEDNSVYFKIFNTEYKMYMKMGVKVDNIGDRNIYGSVNSDTYRHQWYLNVLRHKQEVVFLIYNRQYLQIIKLAREVDTYGDRLLWGNNDFSDNADLFGWRIFH